LGNFDFIMADAENKKSDDVLDQEPPFEEEQTAEDYYFLMQLCENCERYDDMVFYTKKYLEAVEPKYLPPAPPVDKDDHKNSKKDAASDPVHRISVAFKNYVNPLRQRQRIVNTQGNSDMADLAKTCKDLSEAYKDYALVELKERCNEVTDLLDKIIDAFTNSREPDDSDKRKGWAPESVEFKAAYEADVRLITIYKMKGDYFRYISEHNDKKEDKQAAKEAYQKAWHHVNQNNLNTTHPTRLGLALNNSVFLWEIMKEKVEAKDMAKDAFDKGISKLDDASQGDYQDATLIMQLLRDNLTIWQQGDDNNVEDVED